jgi:hypothetical protein
MTARRTNGVLRRFFERIDDSRDNKTVWARWREIGDVEGSA